VSTRGWRGCEPTRARPTAWNTSRAAARPTRARTCCSSQSSGFSTGAHVAYAAKISARTVTNGRVRPTVRATRSRRRVLPYPDEIEDEVRPSGLGGRLLDERAHDGEHSDDVGRQERRRVGLAVACAAAAAAAAAAAGCRRGRGLAAAGRHRAVGRSKRADDVTG